MDKFSVGDVVEIVLPPGAICARHLEHVLGKEGTIVELSVDYVRGIPQHGIEMRDGERIKAARTCLRKKLPPPREQTSTWDDVIVWRPKEIAHVG